MWRRHSILQRNIILKLRRHIRLAQVRLTQIPLSKVLRSGRLIRASAALAAGFDVDGGGEEEKGQDDNDDVGDEVVVGAGELEPEGAIDDSEEDDGGAEETVDVRHYCGSHFLFVDSVVDGAKGCLDEDEEENGEPDDLMFVIVVF